MGLAQRLAQFSLRLRDRIANWWPFARSATGAARDGSPRSQQGVAPPPHAGRYDEEAVVTDYICENFRHLFTDFEAAVDQAGRRHADRPKSSSPRAIEEPAEQVDAPEDAAVQAALAAGYEAFRRRVRDRILRRYGSEIPIERCPSCHRILHGPAARHCFWCGHDWHPR